MLLSAGVELAATGLWIRGLVFASVSRTISLPARQEEVPAWGIPDGGLVEKVVPGRGDRPRGRTTVGGQRGCGGAGYGGGARVLRHDVSETWIARWLAPDAYAARRVQPSMQTVGLPCLPSIVPSAG